MGGLQTPVTGCPAYQMMVHSREIRGMSVKHVFQIQLTNTLKLL